jgi:hypothetical protein
MPANAEIACGVLKTDQIQTQCFVSVVRCGIYHNKFG